MMGGGKWEVGEPDSWSTFHSSKPYRGPWDQDYQDLLGNYVGAALEASTGDPIAQVSNVQSEVG